MTPADDATTLGFTVQTKIRRPVDEVFAAVRDPEALREYFTTGGASGRLEPGTTVTWRFSEYPEDIEVRVGEVLENERITFEWGSGEGEYDTRVEIDFESLGPNETKVSITERGWRQTAKGRERSYQNCEGWTQMSACLKAWMEYGINLREGYY